VSFQHPHHIEQGNNTFTFNAPDHAERRTRANPYNALERLLLGDFYEGNQLATGAAALSDDEDSGNAIYVRDQWHVSPKLR
jgi:hypothetical protein